jgi:SWI/SNF-related matrix-associated actin-dependent regulator of chromatin subfamily A-like protein 1
MSSSHNHPTSPPSADVRAEALARAERLSRGLFTHQVEGVAFLLGRRRAILADDMGLGKTRQSIVALTEAAPVGPWLVVCPASVKRNWAREIFMARPDDVVHVCGPLDPPEVGYTGWVIINYDILAKVDALLEDLPWTGMIFDEAHYLKNHTSKRSKLARELVAAAPNAVLHALTGTPLTNRPRDLFPLLQLVGHPMGRSFLTFAKRYCDARHNGFGWVTDGASNLDELRVQLHGVMLRRTKDEVLDLPPKLRTWLGVSVPEGTGRAETRRVLETLIAGAIERVRGPRVGDEASTRGQDHVRLLANLTRLREQIAIAKAATTIELVEGMVAQGEKIIVFTGFHGPAARIAKHFGDQAVLLTGKTPTAQRQPLVDRFQQDESVRVFVANIIAGGIGINLTAARQVVFNDLDWVPANHWQAEDRAYRIGQTSTVNVTYLSAEGTIDEFVAHALRAKAALIDAVVEGRGAVPHDGDLLMDLEQLVRALSPNIAAVGDDASNEDSLDRLLREATQAVAARESVEHNERSRALHTLPAEAIMALARVLSGPVGQRYRTPSSSKQGAYYVLDVDGGDVICSCSGFEYRGACRHARELKAALATGSALPEGMALFPDV